MKVIGQAALIAWCLGAAACGSSEPQSPLILGDKPARALPGPRDLTSEQSRSLQKVITSAGEMCGAITLAYLADIDLVDGSESWEVRCAEASYRVRLWAAGTPSYVRACVQGDAFGSPCGSPYAERQFRRRQPQGGPLNPDLGKLLEPMTAKDGKTD
jgi:hypothetical protein